MITLKLSAAMLALTAPLPLLAQAAAPPAAEPAKADIVRVALDTDAGRIVLALDRGKAPITTANFLRYVSSGRLKGEGFYRAMTYPTGGGLIQGGVTSSSAKLYPAIEHEPVSKTGISHVAGTVSMASGGPGTARSDFFIIANDSPSFDSEFAAFGRVVEGMDVVQKILTSPVSPTKGEGLLKGQMLDPVVKIGKAEKLAD